jgi:phosphohistidine swiveling domain-containing protein
MKYILMWGEKTSLLTIDFFSQSFIKYRQLPWNKVNNSIIFLKNQKELQGYISLKDYQKLKKLHGNYFFKKGKILQLIEKYKGLTAKFYRFATKINKLNLRTYTREQLLPLFKEYLNLELQVCAWFRGTRPEAEVKAERVLFNQLNKCFDLNKSREVFRIITESARIDTLKRENIKWLNLVKQKKIGDEQLLSHAKQFPDFFINIYKHDTAIYFLRQRLKETKKHLRKRQKELRFLMERLKKLNKERKKILGQCKGSLVKRISWMFRNFGFYRLQLKPAWAGAEFICLPMFERLAHLIGILTEDLCNTYTVRDILNFLQFNKKLPVKIVRDRKRCVVFAVKNKKAKIIEGKEALKFLENTIVEDVKVKRAIELYGAPANQGVYRGRVRILLSTRIQDLFIKRGEILVTNMTQPHMMLIMKKAGAIITDVGGITSHAAIMSREFGIPCVVGTLKATKVLKNGDYVEVDGNKGVIKKLK